MKTLLLLRHAKSDWNDASLDDHDRPLNKRGRRDAPRMGRLLCEMQLVPDLIVSSTAQRAHTTAALVAQAARFDGETVLLESLYHADAEEILDVVAGLDDAHERVLLVGHNPGVRQAMFKLADQDDSFPTATLACLELDAGRWRDLAGDAAVRRARVWRPRQLE